MPISITPPDVLCAYTSSTRVYALAPDDQPDDAFYLTALKKPNTGCWFSRTALGHNTLRDIVNRICKEAGIQGFETNHSLRSTAASRLY